ncbi:MAG: RNA polymerase sigma factor [Faecalimonas sp.]|nr:RNA polymerase sigma factor [Faecalimonas sp.]
MFFLIMEFDDKNRMNMIQELYKKSASKMYHIAMSILNNPSNAEDAVHDAFVSLVKNLGRYDKLTVSEMEALCVVITKNKCLDRIRRERRLSWDEIDDVSLSMNHKVSTMEEMAVRKEQEHMIQRIVNDLPEIYKEIIVLRYFYEFGTGKIAKLLDIPIKTIDSRLIRAKVMMRRLIEDEEKRNR